MPYSGQTSYPVPPVAAPQPSGVWVDGDLDFNGTDPVAVNGTVYTPSSSVYGPLANGPDARNIIVRTGVTVISPNCEWTYQRCELEPGCTVKANGLPGGDASTGVAGTAATINTTPAGNNAQSGDLFAGLGTGGAGITTTGGGNAGTGSGGNSAGGCPGPMKPAGATAITAQTFTSPLTGAARKQFYGDDFDKLFRSQGQSTLASINSGNAGSGGPLRTNTGTGATGAGGSSAAPLVFEGDTLIVGAGASILARGGDGGDSVATGDAIAVGGGPGSGAWIVLRNRVTQIDSTAVIDCDSGVPGNGVPNTATNRPELAAPGTVVVITNEEPHPRQRWMGIGDSLITGGSGDVGTIAVGGPRGWLLHGQKWGGLPWLPVGPLTTGNFLGNNYMGGTGLRTDEVATRMAQYGAGYLQPRAGWPSALVYIRLGANDVNQGTAWATTQAAFESILSTIWTADPNIRVVIANVTDINGKHAAVLSANASLLAWITARSEYNVKLYHYDVYTAVGAYNNATGANFVPGGVDDKHLTIYGTRAEVDGLRALYVSIGVGAA